MSWLKAIRNEDDILVVGCKLQYVRDSCSVVVFNCSAPEHVHGKVVEYPVLIFDLYVRHSSKRGAPFRSVDADVRNALLYEDGGFGWGPSFGYSVYVAHKP